MSASPPITEVGRRIQVSFGYRFMRTRPRTFQGPTGDNLNLFDDAELIVPAEPCARMQRSDSTPASRERTWLLKTKRLGD